jgi:hypothetical protein
MRLLLSVIPRGHVQQSRALTTCVTTNKTIQILLFVYPDLDIIITLYLVILSLNQDTIIFLLIIIQTGGIALLSIDIDSIIIIEIRFFGIFIYIYFILTKIMISCLTRQIKQV